LDRAVVIVRRPRGLTNRNTMTLLLGEDIRRRWRKGRVDLAESTDGLIAAIGAQVAVVSPTATTGSLMDRVVARLNGRGLRPLSRLAAFRTQAAKLSSPRQVLVYWKSSSEPPPAGRSDRWGPAFNSGVMGLYVRSDRIEAVAHEAAPGVEEFVYTPRVLTRPIEHLPQSTLAAWATTVDPKKMWDDLKQQPPHRVIADVMSRLTNRADDEAALNQLLDRVGPRMITVLGCDFDADQRRPFLAVLIECVEPRQVARSLADWITEQTSRPAGGRLGVTSADYMGGPVYELHLPTPSATDRVDTLAALIAGDLRPSFAPMDGWLVASTSPRHIHQILDAARGIEASIANVTSLASERDRIRRSVTAVVVQPAFAVSTLRYWDELMNRASQPDPPVVLKTALGIDVDEHAPPGRVVVTAVHSTAVATDRLIPGDAVLACDQTVLRLTDATADLARLLTRRADWNHVTLRVLRGDELLDLPVRVAPGDAGLRESGEIAGLLDMLAPVEGLASRINLAVYVAIRPPRTTRSAELVFHFAEPAGSSAASSPDKTGAAVSD